MTTEPDFQTGNLWSNPRNYCGQLLCFTSNSFVKNNRRLVMGAGAAYAAYRYKPELAQIFGHQILTGVGHLGVYGLLLDRSSGISPELPLIGAFQTKTNYNIPSSLGLIERSLSALRKFCEDHPDIFVHLNFPGIGYGGLKPEEVKPLLLSYLTDQVTVWSYSAYQNYA
jgi:hypothetical protein